ncbi:transcriptional regulator, TetR family [Rhizobium mongolense subsp. loessense]|uniref:Transcriptional regulator, TetR family n=1 Tax=Rhizobium mongolense subsp. loessense TaxID=158890 RepID=A0A1G4U5I9_9HYPH|nr:TetR/AcrR family transcriptional regulator [Rhizobium mongolense]SCW88922.1 transcriptional regulator, TetR family [Rhizobium mongolense subsp. loessense]
MPAQVKANAKIIIQAAEQLIWQHGYQKVRIADIARDLGMSRASVYRFFGSKEELRRTIFRDILDGNYSTALSIAKLSGDAASRIRRYLQKQYLTTIDLADNHRAIYDLIVLSLDRDHDLVKRHIVRIRNVLATVIADGIDRGEFVPQNPRRTSRIFIMATAKVWHPKLISNQRVRHKEAQIHNILDFALNGLRPAGRISHEVVDD